MVLHDPDPGGMKERLCGSYSQKRVLLNHDKTKKRAAVGEGSVKAGEITTKQVEVGKR